MLGILPVVLLETFRLMKEYDYKVFPSQHELFRTFLLVGAVGCHCQQ